MIGLALAGLFPFASLVHAACSNPSPLPSGYAAPCPVWSVSPATVSQSGTLTLSATPQPGTDYIYTTAYYAKGSTWLPVTLTGDNAAPSYSTGVASGPLSASILSTLTPGTNYVVLWDWLWDATAGCYKGPGLNQCNTGTWRVQTFTITAPTPTPAPSTSPTGCTTGCNNYYVSSSGNDSNNGTSPSTPWKTIAKVNGFTLTPGDTVSFKRGDSWIGANAAILTPGQSGTAGNPITFNSYGSGALPILDAENTRFHVIIVSSKSYITITGLQLQNVTFASHGEGLISIASSNHIIFQGNILKNTGNIATAVDGTGSSFITVDNNILTGTCTGRFYSVSGTSINNDNQTISHNTIPDCTAGPAIFMANSNNSSVFGNDITGNGIAIQFHACNRSNSGDAIYDNLIKGSHSSGDREVIELTGRNNGGQVGNCNVGDGSGTDFTETADVYRNLIIDNANTFGGIDGFITINSKIYDNMVIKNANPGAGSQYAFQWTSRCTGNVFYNNSVYIGLGTGAHAFGFSSNGGTNIVKNNAVYNTGVGSMLSSDPGSVPITDYNIMSGGFGGVCCSPSAHDLVGVDPKFSGSAPAGSNDFKLQSGSPAINSGVNLGSPYNLALDPSGSSFPYSIVDQNSLGTGWERGAFAF